MEKEEADMYLYLAVLVAAVVAFVVATFAVYWTWA